MEYFFEFSGKFDFFQFTCQCFFVGKLGIFDKLLADSGGALFKRSGAQVGECGADHSFIVKTMMGIEIFIFRTDKSVFDTSRDFGKVYRFMFL